MVRNRGVARNLLWGKKEGICGTEVPQRGPGAEPRWGLGGSPQKPEINANFQLRRGDMHPCPLLATPLVRNMDSSEHM